jgi:hypothetical protein
MATKQSSAPVSSENYTVTSEQARRAVQVAFKSKRPLFIWGPPGIGKSEMIAELASDMGGLMIDLRMAQMEPTDLRGIPFFNKDNGKMDWAPPIDLPDEETASQYPIVVLFLDEMNSAPPSVQAAGYQLILNRRVGKYRLPDNVVIVAAGNRESDKGVTYRMPMPLANRFLHIEMRSDFASWQTWAVTHNIHKDVVAYLSFAKQDMYDFDSKSSSRAFATPRSWVFVSQLLDQEHDMDNDTLFTLVAGAVGEGLATKFMAYRKIAGRLPEPSAILNGTVTELDVKEMSAMYSLTISLCYELRDTFDKKLVDQKEFNKMFDNFLGYIMKNFEPEMIILGSRIALKTYKLKIDPQSLVNFKPFHSKYSKYILDTVTR